MIGGSILTARIASGLTQTQLSEQADVTPAVLSRYENDLLNPDRATLKRIAEVLGVTEQLLHSSFPVRGALAVDVHMRRPSVAPPQEWRRVEAQMNILRTQFHNLLRKVCYVFPYVIPSFDPMCHSVSTIAWMTRAQWKMAIGPVRNLTGWLESAGCLVLEWDFGATRIDGMSQWVGDYPVIAVNSCLPADRKRLTLAHELAHLVMHSGSVPLDGEMENEANEFAYEFLMHSDVIGADMYNMDLPRVSSLKRKWMVPMSTLIERAHQMRKITATDRNALYKTLSAKGWRKYEPLSDEIPPERPSLPLLIVDEMLKRRYTYEQIAELGGFSDANRFAHFLSPRQGIRLLK